LLIVFRTVYHKSFIFQKLIGLGENRSPGVFIKFTRPKVKVTWVTCDQLCKQFLLNILKTIDYKAWRHLHHSYAQRHIMSIIPLLYCEPFLNRLLVHINHPSIKNPFRPKTPGGHMCCVTFLVYFIFHYYFIFLIIIIIIIIITSSSWSCDCSLETSRCRPPVPRLLSRLWRLADRPPWQPGDSTLSAPSAWRAWYALPPLEI